jgi:hypothetical protein
LSLKYSSEKEKLFGIFEGGFLSVNLRLSQYNVPGVLKGKNLQGLDPYGD